MSYLEAVVSAIFMSALFVNSLLFLPQAWRIYKEKSSESVSALTFTGFIVIQLACVLYGVIKSDKLMIIGYGISIIACGSVVYLTMYYRLRPKQRIK